jgi:hypothetical protein
LVQTLTILSLGAFVLSKNRGKSFGWGGHFNNITGGNPQPTDFFFLNHDTIFGIASTGFDGVPFAKTFDGGKTWQYNIIGPNYIAPSGVFARTKKEVFVVGGIGGKGVVMRSNDLGESWYIFKTGLSSQLRDIELLNDSIALVSGSNTI